ncbi:MAG: hypothetical protein R3F14_12620 [Polyangiaceae bacterium]
MIEGLRGFRGVALVVSHDRGLLDAVCTGTLRVRGGRVDVSGLPYSQARAEWEREEEARGVERERRVQARDAAQKKLAEARDRRAQAEGMRSSKRRMKNAKDHDARGLGAKFRVERAEHRLGQLVGARRSEALRAEEAVGAFEGERKVGRSVFVGYEAAPRARVLWLEAGVVRAGERAVLRDVSLGVGRTDRIHVKGVNGAGKTTLLRALVEASGMGAERMLYLPQDMTAREAEGLLREVRSLEPGARGRTLSLVAALGVDPGRLLSSQAPSPGEARKLSLAMSLGRRVWALVLDEPTNHLDLPSIERLEAALREYPGALVVVSHDARFAGRVTTATWTVRGGRVHLGEG